MNHTPNTEQRERAEFEAWSEGHAPGHSRAINENGNYEDYATECAWAGWHARATQAAPASPEPANTIPMLRDALAGALATITDYLEYEHNGDPWVEDARTMGEMDINDYESDGRMDAARLALSLTADFTLRAPASPITGAVPDGWQLVPIEPTEDMLNALFVLPDCDSRGNIIRHSVDKLPDAYRAMLANSPASPNTGAVDNRRCKPCGATRGGDKCWKCGADTFTPDPRCGDDPALPPIDRIRELAKEVGYAIGVHGSQQRDFDVIAAPWTDAAIGNHALLVHLAKGLATENGPAHIISTERKPLGRYAATIQMDGWYKQLDISVCPNEQYERATPDTPSPRKGGEAGAAEWISVDERLPTAKDKYLTACVDQFGYVLMAIKGFNRTKFTETEIKVTHWMPLPPPPKEEA